MRHRNTQILLGIIALALLGLWVVWPRELYINIPGGGTFQRQIMRLGLDLQGGTHIVFQADLSRAETPDAVQVAMHTVERRINAYGVAEPVIEQWGKDRISVQLPGVRDIDEALRLIGATAQLDFREQVMEDGQTKWVIAKGAVSGQERELTGKYLKPNATVVLDPTTSEPNVAFEFNSEGAQLFEQITGRLVGKPLGIFLDGQLVSAPTVRAIIRERGVIEGLNANEARTLSIQLNEGALPVPLTIIQREDVDATLGADSVRQSLLAGQIGMGLVILFMILSYRLPGLLASAALAIYAILLLSIFKLWPVTLSLAGIAAFILSIGMAVDATILIFERMKEEVRAGRTMGAAMEEGFRRAWPSIRDSNVSTFITCAILYWFGSTFGASLVMGFALTLFLGVAVSMFTALTVTQTFLRAVATSPLGSKVALFAGVAKPHASAAPKEMA